MNLENSKSNTAIKVWHISFVAVLGVLGFYVGWECGKFLVRWAPIYQQAVPITQLVVIVMMGIAFALALGLLASAAFNRVVRVGESLKEMAPNEKFAMGGGVIFGVAVTAGLSPILLHIPGPIGFILTIVVGIVLVYFGVSAAISMKDELRIWPQPQAEKTDEATKTEACKILDTNVIIDGRVADICRTGFLEGPIYVPGFVLDELQHIADSGDSLKRARGRRGLDILNQMRAELKMAVRTWDLPDQNAHEEVDTKLVKLAKELRGMIVTNDFNLNKVAELQGVQVLNINELANALKPVVLPGEEMRVLVIKEGKEPDQGVAYLDDGTMIVVEGGRRFIGETLDVITNSVLQTAAGKMIFAKIRPATEEYEDDGFDRSVRAYPRSGPRRKIQH